MKLLKGIGLLALGFFAGFVFTSYWLEDSIDKALKAQENFEQSLYEVIDSENETRLRELEAAIQVSTDLLHTYKSGSDLKTILYSHIQTHKEELQFFKEFEAHLDQDLALTFNELKTKNAQLEEDVEFYFGPL